MTVVEGATVVTVVGTVVGDGVPLPSVLLEGTPPGIEVGTTVGTVDGWRAVSHVAVVGQGVAATVGEVVAYGEGPGTTASNEQVTEE